MAYKFQLGPARLSGSVIQEGDITLDGNASLLGSEGNQAVGSDGGEIEQGWFAELNATTRMTASALQVTNDALVLGNHIVGGNADVTGFLRMSGSDFVDSDRLQLSLAESATIGTDSTGSMIQLLANGNVKIDQGLQVDDDAYFATAIMPGVDGDGSGIQTIGTSGQKWDEAYIVNLNAEGVALDDASGLAGEALADNAGVLDVQVQAAGGIEISSSALQVKQADNSLFADSQGLKVKLDNAGGLQTVADGLSLKATIAGDGLAFSSGVIDVNAGNGISTAGDEIAIQLSGTTGLTVDGDGLYLDAVPNASLANSTVSYGGVQLSLGGVDATPAFDLTAATSYPGDSSLVTVGPLNSGSITSGFGSINVGSSAISTTGTGSFGKVTVSGDLEVLGSTITANVTNLNIEDTLIGLGFEDNTIAGSPGDRGLIMGLGSEDNVAMFWDEDLSQFAMVRTDSAPNATTVNVTNYADLKVENLVASTVTAAVVDGVQTVSTTSTIDLTNGIVVLLDASSAGFTATLPTAANYEGVMVKLKKKEGSTNAVVIEGNGSETLDGSLNVSLESPYAAINLISDGSNWFIL